ncbi:MAG TPA: hypothetical protein VJQ59_13930 [Candidatus Sulfotelmatobacter sp.]|nr:hypothetical protein [Candidatus Sulfotelmatobacter sp.]
MSDIQATTPTEGAAISSSPQFDSFFSEHSIVDAPKKPDAAPADQNAAQQQDNTAQIDPNAQQQQDGQQQDNDQPQYATLDELLAAHKIDPQSVRSLNLTTKIDGVEGKATLADLIESYQLKGHVNNKSVQLANDRSAWENERAQHVQQLQAQFKQNQDLGNVAMQMLTHEYQRVDWNALRAQNPAEFAALQAEFQQRQGQIQNYIGVLNQQAQQQQFEQQQSMQKALAQEHELLMNAVPEWRTPETFKQDKEAMTKYAQSLGFKDAELAQIYDHRYMRILHDAARYQALQASNPETLKQIRQAPRMAAPGSRQDVNPSEVGRKQILDRLNRNPRDEDAQAAAFDFFARS